jgi:hypothetical protein
MTSSAGQAMCRRSTLTIFTLSVVIALWSTLLVAVPGRPDDARLGMRTNANANASLGSSDAAAILVTSNYAKAFEQAIPSVDLATLEKIIVGLLAKYAAGFDPLKIRTPQDIARLLALPPERSRPGSEFVVNHTGSHYYGIDTQSSRVVFASRPNGMESLTFADAEGMHNDIRKAHLDLLAAIGIDASQLLFDQTLFLLAHPDTAPPQRARVAKNQVEGIFTYALRSLDGVQVEGSYVKLVSRRANELVSMDIVWPTVKLHPGITYPKPKNPEALRREILPEVGKRAGGQKISLLMAIVLRPVLLKRDRVFVPSIKVGLISEDDGSDAGSVFYVDLLRNKLPYDAEDVDDGKDGHDEAELDEP